MTTVAHFCSGCGAPLVENAKFCEKCGAHVGDATAAGAERAPEPAPVTPAASGRYQWDYAMPLVTSRFFLADTVLALGIAIVAMYGLVAVAGLIAEGKPVLLPWQMGAGLFVGLFLLFGVISLAVFQNRVDVTYVVDRNGITQTAGAKARKVNRIVLVLALLSGKGGAIGSGLLAQSREETHIGWTEVRGLWLHPKDHVIEVRDTYFRMTRIFCPPELYDAVAAMVHAGVAAHPRRPHPLHWRQVVAPIAWALGALGAAVLAPAWNEDLAPWAFGAAGLVIVARLLPGWAGRMVAAGGLLVVLAAAAQVAAAALERTDFGGLFGLYGYERDTDFLVITCAGLLVLGGMALWRLLRRERSDR